jgi:hypothetical protein
MGGLVSCLPTSAWACSACFGKSDAPMAQGMNMGIFTLLLVITSVLLGIATFFAYIIRRAARMESANSAGLNESAPPKPAATAEAHTI